MVSLQKTDLRAEDEPDTRDCEHITYVVMAYPATACMGMAYAVMAYAVMAHLVMVDVLMAHLVVGC